MGRTCRKEKVDECEKYLTYLVEEMDDLYFEDEDNRKILESLLVKSETRVNFKLKCEERKIVVLFKYDSSKKDSLIEDLVDYIKESIEESEKTVQLIGIVENAGEKNSLLNLIRNNKSKICKDIKRRVSCFSYNVIFIPNVDKLPIDLNVTRMNSLFFPEPNINLNVMPQNDCKKESMSGCLVVVSLNELVKIYNRVGDELFASNLRYGIEDKMSLENSMRNTLLEEPDMFWFYNNGITIVTEQDTVGIDSVGKIILSTSWDDRKLDFSVINGAQTISTASRIFNDSDIEKEKLENARKKAKVLLRIITAKEISTRRKITIALNRQKPIRPEDIAFQTTFISEFNEYMRSRDLKNKDYLYIIKRGEPVYDDNTIELPVFVQLVYACFMNPTDARNSGPAKLYYENGNYEKLNSTYFIKEFAEPAPSGGRDHLFNKYYQEIMWAYKIFKAYNAELKNYTDKDDKTLLANNRWSFVSYVLKTMNNFSGNLAEIDYTGFHEKEEFISQIRKYMNEFIEIVKCVYGNQYKPDDSKVKEFWENICKQPLTDLFRELAETEKKDEERISNKEFIKYLEDTSFKYDESLEAYTVEVDCLSFSEVCIKVNEESFNISTMLFDGAYNMDDYDDNDKKKYEELLDEVIKKFKSQIGKEPEIEEYSGCPDPSVDIVYNAIPFDKSFVDKFISVMCEVDLLD